MKRLSNVRGVLEFIRPKDENETGLIRCQSTRYEDHKEISDFLDSISSHWVS